MEKSESVKSFTAYFHRDKDSNYEAFGDLGGDLNSSDARTRFAYMGMEIGLATMVDIETGECVAYGIHHNGELINFEKEVPLS